MMKRRGCFVIKHFLRNMNQLRMSQIRTGKIYASLGGTETIVWNIFSYQVPVMVGNNYSTNKNCKFYNSTVQAISTGVGYCDTKFGDLCNRFVGMGAPVKTQV